MKKILMVCLGSFMALVLAACNSTADPVEGSKDAPKNEEISEKSDLTLEEVYEKTVERQNALESASADIDMEQTMTFGNGTESLEMTTKSNMAMDMIVEPLAMYTDGTMSMADPETGEDMDIEMEMYMTEEGLFMYESESQQWLKLPTDEMDAVLGQTANQVNASEQLKELQTFIEDFKFEQTDSEYVLTLNAASEEFSKYILEQMQLSEMVGLPEEEQEVMENLKFENVNYVITIDKETFDINKMDTVLDMVLDIEGEVVKVATNTKINYKDFNSVEDIVVPQEVIENAEEVQY